MTRQLALSPVAVALVVMSLLAGGSHCAASSASDAGDALNAMLNRVRARQGIQHRSMVVVPLVLKGDADMPGPTLATSDVTWAPARAAGRRQRVAFALPEGAAAASVLIPSGTVLREGAIESMLLHPVVLTPGAKLRVPVVPMLPPSTKGGSMGGSMGGTEASDTPPARTIGGLAPTAFRHLLRAEEDATPFRDLLDLQEVVADLHLEGAKAQAGVVSLARLMEAPSMATRRKAALAALRPLGASYGGRTVGHLAFRGNRAVELVLTMCPATYTAYWQRALDGLAHSLVVWEELHNLSTEPIDDVEWLPFLDGARRSLRRMTRVHLQSERAARSADESRIWSVGPARPVRRQVGGWFVQGPEGQPQLLELWSAIAVNPMREPRTDPTRPETPAVSNSVPTGRRTNKPPAIGTPDGDTEDDLDDEDFGGTSGGAFTRDFLERMLERLRERDAEREADQLNDQIEARRQACDRERERAGAGQR